VSPIESALAVVIVNWNGRQHLGICLAALQGQSYAPFRVIVVDNGSSDDSVEFVRALYPDVELIQLEGNRGFAAPCNMGISRALERPEIEFIVTLNNDTDPEPTYLEELVACARRNPTAGAVQPKVVNYFEADRLDSTGIMIAADMSAVNRGLGETDRGQYGQEEEIFGAAASAALYPRAALEQVALPVAGGPSEFFDGSYFAYHEDVDLAWRLRLSGFQAYYTPRAVVRHVHSATGKSRSPFKAFYVHRNHLFNLSKNLPLFFLLRALALLPLMYLWSLVSVLRGRGAASGLGQTTKGAGCNMAGILLRGWGQFFLHMPGLLAKRKQIQARRRVSHREISSWFKLYRATREKIHFS